MRGRDADLAAQSAVSIALCAQWLEGSEPGRLGRPARSGRTAAAAYVPPIFPCFRPNPVLSCRCKLAGEYDLLAGMGAAPAIEEAPAAEAPSCQSQLNYSSVFMPPQAQFAFRLYGASGRRTLRSAPAEGARGKLVSLLPACHRGLTSAAAACAAAAAFSRLVVALQPTARGTTPASQRRCPLGRQWRCSQPREPTHVRNAPPLRPSRSLPSHTASLPKLRELAVYPSRHGTPCIA